MVDRSGARVRAAVVGTGLIGGSVLLRMYAAGVDVVGWDPDEVTRRETRRLGVPAPDRLVEAVADRDVVFLCGPLPTLPATLVEVAAMTGERCVLTDVGSTKEQVAAFAAAQGLTHRFVPGHPMAGTDRAGLTAALADLLTGAAWVLCPAPGPATTAFRWLAELLVEVFEARVVPMSATEHDSAAALASHVPHLLAGALAGAVQRAPLRDAILALAAGSFSDGTGSPEPRPSGPPTCCSATGTGCCVNWPRSPRSWTTWPPRCAPTTPRRSPHATTRRELPARRCATGGSMRTTGSSRPAVTTPQRCPGCASWGWPAAT